MSTEAEAEREALVAAMVSHWSGPDAPPDDDHDETETEAMRRILAIVEARVCAPLRAELMTLRKDMDTERTNYRRDIAAAESTLAAERRAHAVTRERLRQAIDVVSMFAGDERDLTADGECAFVSVGRLNAAQAFLAAAPPGAPVVVMPTCFKFMGAGMSCGAAVLPSGRCTMGHEQPASSTATPATPEPLPTGFEPPGFGAK
ncbi:MAG TPA: hypothetical protein VNM39_17165 [Verrucomicrobiae bacterium]|nr:hypothetical protein [Verrucomicrobiae bacterium]